MNRREDTREVAGDRRGRRSARILVVDDREENRLVLTTILEGTDWVVEEASSGREALRRLLRQDYALVLLDVNMPEMDGFETAQLIRQRPASAHTPIVFVTAHHDDALLARSYELGAVDFITSPVRPDVLRAKASVFVQLFRQTEENRRQADQLRRAEERLRRQAEERLRRVDEWLRLTVESISDYAIFSLDTEGRIATWNAGAQRLFGLDEREAIGSTCMVLFPPEACDDEPHWRIARVQGRTEVEAWFQAKGGRRFFGRGVVTAMRDASGEIVGYSKVVQDVTMRKQTEEALARQAEQLREANRLKDEFLAVLSHELRTPLNAIIGWTHLLQRAGLTPDLARQALDTIARNGQMQLALINDILDVSRFITGKVRLSLAPVDLGAVIRAAVDTVAMAAEAKHIELSVNLEGDEPLTVNGDAERLQQVVWNLVANAVKFTSEGGHIRVAAQRTDRTVRLTVSDDGVGIAPEFLPYVFDRFRQADSSTVRAHGGLGLGLAIVKHLMDAHGGYVEARSEGEGRGSTFELRLPVQAALRAPHSVPAPEPAALTADLIEPTPDAVEHAASLTGLRCLVVDDSPDARALLKTVLGQAGALVVDVATAGEAMTQLDGVDLLVADIGMPEEDGYSLIRRIRSLPPERGGRVPAIALTAYASPKDRRAALDAGFDAHQVKPLHPAEFFRTVAAIVGARGGASSDPQRAALTVATDPEPRSSAT